MGVVSKTGEEAKAATGIDTCPAVREIAKVWDQQLDEDDRVFVLGGLTAGSDVSIAALVQGLAQVHCKVTAQQVQHHRACACSCKGAFPWES